MTYKSTALFILLAAGIAPQLASAEDAAQPVNHGYVGVGLLLASNSFQSPAGDVNSTGGGLAINGAGSIGTASGIGFGFNGGLDFENRTDDNSNSYSAVQFGFDGGAIFADLFYVSLGLQFLAQTPDYANAPTATYTVVPLGIGILKAEGSGYGLAQLRFGGGQLSNDQTSNTEDVSFFGIRLAGQTGTEHGLQFMGGMDFDTYTWSSVDVTDSFFRVFFGVGFGG